MLTKEEVRWIKRAQRLFRDRPVSILLYTTDGEITACKIGLSSNEFCAGIADFAIGAGAVLTDMHDDNNNGLYDKQ